MQLIASPNGGDFRIAAPQLGQLAQRFGAMRHRVAAPIVAATLAVASVAGAQVSPPASASDTLSLSIVDVQRLIVQQNPGFLATRQETAIAGGGLRQARLYQFNPDLSFRALGGNAATRGGQYEATVTQEIEWAGQRGLRIDAARTGVTRATSVVQNAGRMILAEGSISFYRALAAARRMAVAREALALTQRLIAAVRTQLAEGEISTLEANLAEIEAGRAQGRLLNARRVATSAELDLKQLLGFNPDKPILLDSVSSGIIEGALDQDSLIAVALARRPDLAASSASVRELETLTSLARRLGLPNLRLGATIERGPSSGPAQVGPAIGISLPMFNRNQGLVQQREALTEQARFSQREAVLRVRTDVTEAVRAYRIASDEAAVFETSVVRPARENIALLEIAYREGKIALPTLLLLRNQLLDAEFGYWDAWLAQREARVRLEAATGALTPPVESLTPPDTNDDSAAADASSRNIR